tara:strand:+ start:254 stop:1348 length:1095 start_codon:yes stop_codon:yes gene_type:complete
MTSGRHQQILLDETPYYHCISRCVRRAYLCGDDPISGQNFDHRKQWLITRIKQLAAQFAIDVCAYAIMNNHYHLVLFVNEVKAKNWTDKEVIRHWTALFPRNSAIIETLHKNNNSHKARKFYVQQVKIWRERLADISWFMRCLNESVARKANKEDECKGRFWEGRFKSQALLDEKALVACMAYVDLNPIRAHISETLDSSDYTSIQERLISHAKKVKTRSYRQRRLLTRRGAKHLLDRGNREKKLSLKPLAQLPGISKEVVPISRKSYFELLETTGKALKIGEKAPHKAMMLMNKKRSVLNVLGISTESWLKNIMYFHRYYGIAAGVESSLIKFHKSRWYIGANFKHSHKWIRGVSSARLLFGA